MSKTVVYQAKRVITMNDDFGAAPADIVRVSGGVVTDLKRA